MEYEPILATLNATNNAKCSPPLPFWEIIVGGQKQLFGQPSARRCFENELTAYELFRGDAVVDYSDLPFGSLLDSS